MASADVYEQRLCHFFPDVWSPAISEFYWTVLEAVVKTLGQGFQ